MRKTKSTLVIAFDGLDKELIDEFDLNHIKQEEYGKIDNQVGTSGAFTSELFASFITGKTHHEHGVKGLNKHQGIREKIRDILFPRFLLQNIRGATRLKNTYNTLFNIEKRKPAKNDLKSESIFDEIDNSKAHFVPSWNPSPYWQVLRFDELKANDVEDRSLEYYWDNYEYETRKRRLFRPINKWHDLCMLHLHRPDAHQHFYGDRNLSTFSLEKLEKLYKETDELAGNILDFFSEDYDIIIFMSDHGLPTEDEHNENAFYSCNEEIFPNEKPKITDFHDKIVELCHETE